MKTTLSRQLIPCLLLIGLVAAPVYAKEPALLRIERLGADDRNTLLAAGLPLVAELSESFLAFGDEAEVERQAAALGFETIVIDRHTAGDSYALAGLRPGWSDAELSACAPVVWREEQWVLLKAPRFDRPSCTDSTHWMLQPLTLERLEPGRPPPAAFAHLAAGEPMLLLPDPLVQEMVDAATAGLVLSNWTDVVDVAVTRHSYSSGCIDAADLVYSTFSGLGLAAEYHSYDPSFAPSALGTLEGSLNPGDIYIAIGHLDDMPSSPPAPGANDNASGSAMVVTLARIMSEYAFANTVKFIAVTGEEQGLVGSRAWAAEAFARGDNILGVLNGDMIGWEGDGQPSQENLDLNFNNDSAWLGSVFVQAAADYNTGLSVDAFLCPSLTASDHAAFWEKGYSAVCGSTDNEGYCGHGGHYPYYHTSNDTIANCGDPAFYIAAVRGYLATLAHLADPLCRKPSPPDGLTAAADGENRIALSWLGVPAAASYEILRQPEGCSSGHGFYPVGETSSTSFVDTTASGSLVYGYVVQAKDPTGYCLSTPSLCVEAVTSGDCIEPPIFAGVDRVSDNHGQNCSLTVDWPPVDRLFCGGGARFNVYRSTQPGFEPDPSSLVASCLTGQSLVDSEVQPDTEYFYIVRAEDDTVGHGGPCGGNEDRNTERDSATPGGPRLFGDDFENGLGQWQADNPWTLVSGPVHGGSWSAFGGNQSDTCAALTMNQPVVLPVDPPARLSFWALYDLEATYDGVQMQISTDGGGSWQLLEPVGGYPGTASANCNLKVGNQAFNGASQGWSETIADLGTWAGESVSVRFVMASDGWVNNGGFYLDDLDLGFGESCEAGLVFSDGFESGDTSAWSQTLP